VTTQGDRKRDCGAEKGKKMYLVQLDKNYQGKRQERLELRQEREEGKREQGCCVRTGLPRRGKRAGLSYMSSELRKNHRERISQQKGRGERKIDAGKR